MKHRDYIRKHLFGIDQKVTSFASSTKSEDFAALELIVDDTTETIVVPEENIRLSTFTPPVGE